jgi:hypothetical protein
MRLRVCMYVHSCFLFLLLIFCSDNNIWLVYLKLNPFEITHARVSFVLFVRVSNYVQLNTRNPASVTRSFSCTFRRLPVGFSFSSNARLMEWCNTTFPQYPSWNNNYHTRMMHSLYIYTAMSASAVDPPYPTNNELFKHPLLFEEKLHMAVGSMRKACITGLWLCLWGHNWKGENAGVCI